MSHKTGSLLGGTLLITGSCVGAGMLGLPILTGLSGFAPSLVMFVLVWLFMTITGLLLVEANGWFSKKVNFISIVSHSLGKGGKILCLVTCLFLFYSLLVAYIAGSGSLFSSLMQSFGWIIPSWVGSFAFVALFGVVVYAGTRQVDLWNRVLMAFKITFFFALILIGTRFIQPKLLTYTHPSLAIFSLPILVISFGFHNMIPTLTSYMKGDLKRVRLAIFGGSLFSFFIYLLWQILVLGTVSVEGLVDSFKLGQEGSQALVAVIKSPWIALFAQGLAFFAILTSFLAQSLSLVHFLADGFKVSSDRRESPLLCSLVLIPPLILAFLCPRIFFQALNFAGGFCAVLLFGILPVLILWIGRYRKAIVAPYVVPGGKPLLCLVFAFACFIFIFQLLSTLGVISLIKDGLHG
ncbi:MAG: tyrosine transporter [Rhabdochlamydiaceae bacterium]|nr:tyrosine transporter [Rhabdochlamydiaceae bacterium]